MSANKASDNKIPVNPKLIYTSKTFLGGSLATATGLIMAVQTTMATPGQLGKIADNFQDKYGPIVGFLCTGLLTIIGSVDRPELFFRRGKLKEAVSEASARLTMTEVAETAKQGWDVLVAPTEQKFDKAVQMFNDTQKRLGETQDRLERIERAVTYQHFSNQDIAHLPGPSPETQHVNRVANRPPVAQENILQAEAMRQGGRFQPPVEPAQQVELSGVQFDVSESNDGVLQGY